METGLEKFLKFIVGHMTIAVLIVKRILFLRSNRSQRKRRPKIITKHTHLFHIKRPALKQGVFFFIPEGLPLKQ
jgi:hypothetical protein